MTFYTNIQTFDMFNENIKFNKVPKKKGSKTDKFNVIKDGIIIGQIKWSSRIRGYSFLPTDDCDDKIKAFIKNLMNDRKRLDN